MNKAFISVIIPLKQFNNYIREAIKYYENLNYLNFELIILPDKEEKEVLSKKLNIKVIATGEIGPAEKRDIGAKEAKGEILAFTDDDAYPDKNWLKNAIEILFSDEKIGAVGGPGITPKNDGFWQKVSGNVYASFWMSGSLRKRYFPVGKAHEDYDIPSVNFIVKKEIFEKVGGFDSNYYPGEDTKLCLEIKKIGYKIIYSPNVIVYHHRRNLFFHLKQISNYALHRGFFVKRYPETSFKIHYFLPSIFLIGVTLGGILCFLNKFIGYTYGISIGIYFLFAFISTLKSNILEIVPSTIAIFLSHLTYGIFFIKGLLTSELKR